MANLEAFVQASEVWVPEGDRLRLRSGAYAGATEFARVSARKSFEKGEGLPGSVWQGERAEIWEELGTSFVRRELAKAAGIEAAVGVPVFRGEELSAVVVLLCGKREQTQGCIEIWDVDHEHQYLSHAAGYYDRLGPFGEISRLLQFESGSGLPGLAWQRGAPTLVESLLESPAFTRTPLLAGTGLTTGLALPVRRRDVVEQIVLLLSAPETPIARVFEVWVPAERGLVLVQGAYAPGLEPLARRARATTFARGEGLPGAVWESALPQVFDRLDVPAFRGYEAAADAGLEVGIGIPFYDGGALSAVAVLLS